MTILPGLINSHAHLAWDGIHDLARQSMDDARTEISAWKSAANMLRCLRAGITLVRDLGMRRSNLFAKQAIEQRHFPRGRACSSRARPSSSTPATLGGAASEASGSDGMRQAVREQVSGGADLIKIMACHDTLEFHRRRAGGCHRRGASQRPARYRARHLRRMHPPRGRRRRGRNRARRLDERGDHRTAAGARHPHRNDLRAALLMQSQPELARQYHIPEWKIAERQRMVADRSRYAGLVAAAQAGVPIAFGTDAGSPAVAP